MRIVLIHQQSRHNEIVPLLQDASVVSVNRFRDLLSVRRDDDPQTAIMVDNSGRPALLAMLVALRLRAPIVARLRGHIFWEARDRRDHRSTGLFGHIRYTLSVMFARFFLRYVSLAIYNSRWLEMTLGPYVPAKLTAVVHNPALPPSDAPDERQSELPSDGLRLLTVTRMSYHAKCAPLVEAVETVPVSLLEAYDIHWIIAGSGYQEYRLQDAIRRRNLGARIRLIGWTQNVRRLYEWCDVHVYLTGLETRGSSVMEAMYCAKPHIVNEDSCGVRDLIRHQENGLVVSDMAELTAAIRTYAENPELRQQHGARSKCLVETDPELTVEGQRQAMRKALAQLFQSRHDV